MRGLAAFALASALLAGCVGAPGQELEPAGDPQGPPSDPGAAPTPAPPGGAAPNASSDAPPASAGNASGPAPPPSGNASAPVASAPWPPLESAKVRPGVRTSYGGSQCTSNFVFTSPDNASLYLGVAAHCLGPGVKLGDPVDVGGVATGKVAYSSWLAMGSDGGDPVTGANPTCSVEKEQAVCDDNDFALIRIDDAHRALVHPAMRHFGGPTALAASSEPRQGDKVLTYGNSDLRFGLEESNRHEGYVLFPADPWTTQTYTATPGVPGDSGSGVLLADGRAFGVLVTVAYAPITGSNGVTSLDLALEYAKEKAGVDVRLATWDLLDDGLLPAL